MCAKYKGGCVTKTSPTESWGEQVTGDIKSTEVQKRGSQCLGEHEEGSVWLGWAAQTDSELQAMRKKREPLNATYIDTSKSSDFPGFPLL